MSGRLSIRPIPAVLAVILRGQELLLVRRANPPDAGLWGFPGGKIEPGETLAQAAEREAREETGIICRAGPAFAALDAFDHEQGALRAHYVLIALPCQWLAGEPVAADDALEAAWFPLAALPPPAERSRDVDRIAALALVSVGPGEPRAPTA